MIQTLIVFRTYTGPRTKDLLVQIATEEGSVDDCPEEDSIDEP
jgi:hypothetical protein